MPGSSADKAVAPEGQAPSHDDAAAPEVPTFKPAAPLEAYRTIEYLTCCRGHPTSDINAFACAHQAPGQRRACGHRRCRDCLVTFSGSLDALGIAVVLVETHAVGYYPGGMLLQFRLLGDFGRAYLDRKHRNGPPSWHGL